MKAYKFEVVVIDHEDSGLDAVEYHLTDCKYFGIRVISVNEAEIGDWSDDHPMNQQGCDYSRYFK